MEVYLNGKVLKVPEGRKRLLEKIIQKRKRVKMDEIIVPVTKVDILSKLTTNRNHLRIVIDILSGRKPPNANDLFNLKEKSPDSCMICELFHFLKELRIDSPFTPCHQEVNIYILVLILKIMDCDIRNKPLKWEELVNNLSQHICEEILKLYRYYDKNPEGLNNRIFLLKAFLLHWKGWEDTYKENMIEKLYKNLKRYIKINIKTVMDSLMKNDDIIEELDKDAIVSVVCSLRMLKNLFQGEFFTNMVTTKTNNYLHKDELYSPGSLNAWPFITIKLVSPRLTLQRTNISHNDFKLIDHTHGYDPKIDFSMDLGLYYKKGNDCNVWHSSCIRSFIRRIQKQTDRQVDDDKKNELVLFLNECLKDLNLTTDDIETSTEYYVNLSPYPYSRLLSTSDTNIALQQITYPTIKFSVDHFIPHDDKVANNKPTSLIEINLIYKCNLCKKVFNSATSANDIRYHILTFHGFEPAYSCCKCENVYSSVYLSRMRWRHHCEEK